MPPLLPLSVATASCERRGAAFVGETAAAAAAAARTPASEWRLKGAAVSSPRPRGRSAEPKEKEPVGT